MENKAIRRVLFALMIIAVIGLTFGLVYEPRQSGRGENVFSLKAPSFVGLVQADADEIASFLDDEAGISAYFKSPSPITINTDLKSLFRTIETETEDYIIGSIPVPDYTEYEDVHVYVHTDGWVLAYYLATDPIGKIYDWISYDVAIPEIPTKFEHVLTLVSAVVGIPTQPITYYDFRYPNATNLMLTAEYRSGEGADSFTINIPGSFTYYERSWALESETNTYYCRGKGRLYLDDVLIKENGCGWVTSQGILTALQLLPDVDHTVKVTVVDSGDAHGGIALIYRVP